MQPKSQLWILWISTEFFIYSTRLGTNLSQIWNNTYSIIYQKLANLMQKKIIYVNRLESVNFGM